MANEIKALKRINELAALAKERALTPEEQEERQQLRKQYLAEFRAQMRQTPVSYTHLAVYKRQAVSWVEQSR